MKRPIVRVTATILSVVTVTALSGTRANADDIRDDQWHLRYLDIREAHEITKGGGITVAVVDTGVYRHRDLKRNLLPGTDVSSGSNSMRWDEDTNGHGTEMAGLVAAHGRTETDGALGIAPEAKILPIKDANAVDNGNSTTTARGIQWAVANGAKVVNVSSSSGPSLALTAAVEAAAEKDVLIIAGSGNRPKFLNFGYPAAMAGVLAVGAVDRSGKHASFSISGKPLQICAPGVAIESTRPKNRYSIADGTSPATAIVSGAAALVRAKYPNLSAQQVIHRLTATATDIGKPGRDDECGFGVLNVVKALTADVPLPANSDPGTGSAGPTAAPTADAAPSAGGDAPAPDGSAAGSNTPMVVGGAVAVIVLLGGLLALLAARRRRSNS